MEEYREINADIEDLKKAFEQCKRFESERNFPAIAEVLNKLGYINDQSFILYAGQCWFMIYENRKFVFDELTYEAQEEEYQKLFDICWEAEQAGKFEVIADQLNKYSSCEPKSASWLIENFPGWCLTFENGKFSVDKTSATEIKQKIEAFNKVIEMCDFYVGLAESVRKVNSVWICRPKKVVRVQEKQVK